MSKIKDEALRGTANTHKWWTLMAADIISLLSFGQSFGMLGLGKVRKGSSSFQESTFADLDQEHPLHAGN